METPSKRLRTYRRAERGQAVTETALSLLLFTTIFIFGIHFAEVGYLSLKVTEAANFAVFSTPFNSSPTHFAAANVWGRTAVGGPAAWDATVRYQNFDGRTSKKGQTSVTNVFTMGANLSVTCAPNGAVIGTPPTAAISAAANSGVGCSAQADLAAYHIPYFYHQAGSGGFFKRVHYKPTSIHICAVGPASGAGCAGQIGVLVDDWGFTGNGEGAECPLSAGGCTNPAYYDAVYRLYSSTGIPGQAGGELAQHAAGVNPSNESAMWMSFRGEPDFSDTVPGPHWGESTWQTTPFKLGDIDTNYSDSYYARQNCFLGLPCSAL